MFSSEPMLKLSLLVLERDERPVLHSLAESGAMQLDRERESPAPPFAPRNRSIERERCSRAIKQVEELRHSLELALAQPTTDAPVVIGLVEIEKRLTAMASIVESLLKRREDLLQRWTRLTELGNQLSKYCEAGVPLDIPEQHPFLHFVTGSVPVGSLDHLEGEIPGQVALLLLSQQSGRQTLIAMCTCPRASALDQALASAGFERELLPHAQGETSESFSDSTRAERESISKLLQGLENELHSLASQYNKPLAELATAATVEQKLLEAEEGFPRTDSAILITGWVPEADSEQLKRRLATVTAGRCALRTVAAESFSGEQTPVLLRHAAWLRPFEALIVAYGLPKYGELEPTLFMALSYLVMFGMMFGDVGHGAVLALGGCACLWASRKRKWRDAGLLVLFAGLSSISFGLIYGSLFGIPAFKKYALWHDPLEGDPLALLCTAVAVGIALISLGIILNILNRFRVGDVLGGVLDKFGLVGLLFYWGALGLLLKFETFRSHGLVALAVSLFVVVPLVGWTVNKPIERLLRRRTASSAEPGQGLFGTLSESLVGAFEAVLTYLANTISFVRLAAYAMSHAALLAAAFMMAADLRHVSFGGGALSVSVIIAGNFVAIVLEGIIAAVQALRLEYYEFFSKFFSGEGKAFQPFRLTPMLG